MASRGNTGDGIDIYADESGLSGITLSSITVSGFTSGYGVVIGTYSSGAFSSVSLSNVTAYNNGYAGISTYGASESITNFSLLNSTAYNNPGMSGNNGPSGSGIMLAGLGGATVEYCTAYGNGANNNASAGPDGIWAYDSNAVTIAYCNSYNNQSKVADGGGFDLDGGATNSTIMNCTSSNNFGYGYAAFTYTGSAANSGNTFINNSSTGDREGFYYWSAGPVISNLTFTGNSIAKPTSGEAIVGATGSDYVNIVLSPNTIVLSPVGIFKSTKGAKTFLKA